MICVVCQKTISDIDYYDRCIYCHNMFMVDKHKECCIGLEPTALELARQSVNNSVDRIMKGASSD